MLARVDNFAWFMWRVQCLPTTKCRFPRRCLKGIGALDVMRWCVPLTHLGFDADDSFFFSLHLKFSATLFKNLDRPCNLFLLHIWSLLFWLLYFFNFEQFIKLQMFINFTPLLFFNLSNYNFFSISPSMIFLIFQTGSLFFYCYLFCLRSFSKLYI
jgi:hypothetical protein